MSSPGGGRGAGAAFTAVKSAASAPALPHAIATLMAPAAITVRID
jgi:hypothetical protein